MNRTKEIDCACACGNKLYPSDKKGRPRRFLHGHNTKGQHWNWTKEARGRFSLLLKGRYKRFVNPHWKGGRFIDVHGYVWVLCPEHPYATKSGYIREHRLILEAKLGRYLLPHEVPHHINGIKNDNHSENLTLYPNQSEHMRKEHCATHKNRVGS